MLVRSAQADCQTSVVQSPARRRAPPAPTVRKLKSPAAVARAMRDWRQLAERRDSRTPGYPVRRRSLPGPGTPSPMRRVRRGSPSQSRATPTTGTSERDSRPSRCAATHGRDSRRSRRTGSPVRGGRPGVSRTARRAATIRGRGRDARPKRPSPPVWSRRPERGRPRCRRRASCGRPRAAVTRRW
jgi:hypothetical protein